MDNELISIIVPVYNIEDYIKRCIKCLINQSYKNLEIILIDNGGDDNSGNICDKYASKDNRIKVIHKENKGVSAARNAALDIAKGNYIGFVDGDDVLENNMYEVLHKNIIDHKAQISQCAAYVVKEENINNCRQDEQITVKTYSENDKLDQLIISNNISSFLWNKLFDRDLFDNIRLPEDLDYCEDLYIMHKLVDKANAVVCTNQKLYYYIQRSTSVVHNNSKAAKNRNNQLVALVQRYNYLKDPAHKQAVLDNIIDSCFKGKGCLYDKNITDKDKQDLSSIIQKCKKDYITKSNCNKKQYLYSISIMRFTPLCIARYKLIGENNLIKKIYRKIIKAR